MCPPGPVQQGVSLRPQLSGATLADQILVVVTFGKCGCVGPHHAGGMFKFQELFNDGGDEHGLVKYRCIITMRPRSSPSLV